MQILLITNIRAQKGLYRDAVILARLLQEFGHAPGMIDYRTKITPSVDLAIHLEVVEPRFFGAAPWHWWIPNPEWVLPGYMAHMDLFDAVLCKTPDAMRLLGPHTDKLVSTGFMSEDRLDPSVEKEPVFLHAYKGSNEKGTIAIQDAWQELYWPIVMASDMDEEDYQHEQNRCQFHLCPSKYEGWGHTIHEGLSVGAIVVSTDVPPMNEVAGVPFHIEVEEYSQLRLARRGTVSAWGVQDAVQWCVGLRPEQIAEYSRAARAAYEAETASFRKAFGKLLRRVSK